MRDAFENPLCKETFNFRLSIQLGILYSCYIHAEDAVFHLQREQRGIKDFFQLLFGFCDCFLCFFIDKICIMDFCEVLQLSDGFIRFGLSFAQFHHPDLHLSMRKK